jgi:Zn-dependent M16 (insulinase) family peptidase
MSESESQVKLGFSLLCNEIADSPYEAFCLTVLSNLLFEGPNSPMYKNIIESGIAPAFCPGYGYDITSKEATFTYGV